MKLNAKLHTDGRGLWSPEARTVRVKDAEIYYAVPTGRAGRFSSGELRVYFNRQDWNVNLHGLIYTDDTFLKELKAELARLGLPVRGVDYSEQGMQGADYVSLDVGPAFVEKFFKMEK